MAQHLEESIKKEQDFKDDLAAVINKHSRENLSDTPDFILADYLYWCLANFQNTLRQRSEWYREK